MPQLLFLYGPPACGKLTVGRALAARTGFALFHNHLVVDAVAALFPFGSPSFVHLREQFWREAMLTAINEGRSLIFTFAPELSVGADFANRLAADVTAAGGEVRFIRLTVPPDIQEQRLTEASRAAFGKLRSLDLFREMREAFAACDAMMPLPALTIDTGATTPQDAAARIAALIA